MKYVWMFAALIMVNTVNAQIETKALDNKNSTVIELPGDKAQISLAGIFKSVNVIDARCDSGRVGFNNYYESGKVLTKIYRLFPSATLGLAKWESEYLQLKKEDTSDCSLLIVIKNLWLSGEITPIVFENGRKGQGSEGFDAGVVCNFEFYLQRDTVLYPLYRIDSIFTFKESLPLHASFFLSSTFKQASAKLFTYTRQSMLNRRVKLSPGELAETVAENETLPILTCTNFKKGVYRNFEEFKMNAPSIATYELRTENLGDIVYLKEGDNEYPERKVWGLCDGTSIFINSGDKYSKLIRQQHTFYFAGIKALRKRVTHDFASASLFDLATDSGRKSTRFLKVIKYYEVNMQNGEAQ